MNATEVREQQSNDQTSLSVWKRRLRRWGPWVAVFLLGVFIGQVGGVPAEELDAALAGQQSAEEKTDEFEGQLEAAEAELENADADAEAAEEEAVNAKAAAREDLEAELADRRDELESEHAAKKADLEQRASALDEREAAITQQEEIAAKSTFSNGVYEVGVDIVPGKYKTDGGVGTCYWQKSPVSSADDIIDNDLIDGPTTVVIPEGILFTSKDCGTWNRVG